MSYIVVILKTSSTLYEIYLTKILRYHDIFNDFNFLYKSLNVFHIRYYHPILFFQLLCNSSYN